MSNSQFVCWRDGLPVHGVRDGWRHSMGGKTGPLPRHRRHYPVPILRTLFDRAFAPDTPLSEARAIAAEYKVKDTKIQQEHPQKGSRQ